MSCKKEDYICAVPFTSLEVSERKRFLCCAAWLKKYLPEDSNPIQAWESEEANDIRESILDGSYRYCDDTQCPFLKDIKESKDATINDTLFWNPFYLKNKLPQTVKQAIKKHKDKTVKPTTIQFSFDRTCNLKCPSCRVDIVAASSKEIKHIQETIDVIQDELSEQATTLYITGTGDPFVSVGFRDFLRNFKSSNWPKIYKIHLHTNATKWDEKMWASMPNIHKLVKTCEISIDAGTKETYENKTRLGGNWDSLISNLHFIYNLPHLKSVKVSFVVQKTNYKEMKVFYDLMTSILKEKVSIFYGRINNWGTYSNEEYNNQAVHLVDHPLHTDFVKELNKVIPGKNAWTNLQEFVSHNKTLI